MIQRCQQSCLENAFSVMQTNILKEAVRVRNSAAACKFRADDTIRKVATDRNDTAVMAIASDELVAKVANHATCYRSYTKPGYTTTTTKQE